MHQGHEAIPGCCYWAILSLSLYTFFFQKIFCFIYLIEKEIAQEGT